MLPVNVSWLHFSWTTLYNAYYVRWFNFCYSGNGQTWRHFNLAVDRILALKEAKVLHLTKMWEVSLEQGLLCEKNEEMVKLK